MIRSIHRMIAWLALVPLFVILSTGLLLQFRQWVPWIQPTASRGVGHTPIIPFSQLLEAGRSVGDANIHGWSDIRSIEVKPSKGVASIRTESDYEVSVDLESGKVLNAAKRRTGLLARLHEGSYFGRGVRYGVFIPAGILLFILWSTGGVLMFRLVRMRFKRGQLCKRTLNSG